MFLSGEDFEAGKLVLGSFWKGGPEELIVDNTSGIVLVGFEKVVDKAEVEGFLDFLFKDEGLGLGGEF